MPFTHRNTTVQKGFAVIDFETTGLRPERNDRAIEVGVVLTGPGGSIQEEHETLIHVNRDLGLQERHRIRASDMLNAPEFAQIAGDLVEYMRGRVPVAHNASFDSRFLDAELARLGCNVDRHAMPWTCTMQLASVYGLGARSLAECCDVMSVELNDAHRALADAHATAQLLAAYIANTPRGRSEFWNERLDAAARVQWPDLSSTGVPWYPRPAGDSQSDPLDFLNRLVDEMPDVADTDAERSYLGLLDQCLLDRRLSVTEAQALFDFARSHHMGAHEIRVLHQKYLDALIVAARADGIVTRDERADLSAVAELLRLPAPTERELEFRTPAGAAGEHVSNLSDMQVGKFSLNPGDRVCLTGTMRRERDEWIAILNQAGIVVWPSVTKKVKLLIAADPDSLSGKAQKARSYGLPVVGEEWLEERFGA
jgi:DNA polymerase-3 subunit epsilon